MNDIATRVALTALTFWITRTQEQQATDALAGLDAPQWTVLHRTAWLLLGREPPPDPTWYGTMRAEGLGKQVGAGDDGWIWFGALAHPQESQDNQRSAADAADEPPDGCQHPHGRALHAALVVENRRTAE